jgi:hypothetical protein
MAHIHVGNATTNGGLALTLVPELAPLGAVSSPLREHPPPLPLPASAMRPRLAARCPPHRA